MMFRCKKLLKTFNYTRSLISSTIFQTNNINTLSRLNRAAVHSTNNYNQSLWKQVHKKYALVYRLLNRSNINSISSSPILNKYLHMNSVDKNSSKENQNNQENRSSTGNDGNDDDDDDKKQLVIKFMLFSALTSLGIFSMFRFFSGTDESKQQRMNIVSWNDFVSQMVAKGEVKEIIVSKYSRYIKIILHDGAVYRGRKVDVDSQVFGIVANTYEFEDNLREIEKKLKIPFNEGIPVEYEASSIKIAEPIIALIMLAVFWRLSKGGKMSSKFDIKNMMGTKAKFTIIDPRIPGSGRGVKFSDVAGASAAKQEVIEFVDFLRNPTKYRALGAKVPKGAILLGPPGCGKTMLAKAVATEGKVPFITMNGSEFIEMIGGVGASRVRDLFKEAKKRSPCIIYIDEVDAVGKQRGGGGESDGSSGESEQTLNQLLVEMDGMGTKAGVILLASTNRMDILDKALLRPGRFDRHITMDLPTLDDRKEIFDHHLKSIVLEKKPEYYSKRMASLTLGFSGADIANVVNESALRAARNAKKLVVGNDLELSIEKVIGGTEKMNSALSPEEREVVAYHESGHALLGWLLEHTDALLKVTIVPRTNQSLGFAQYSPSDKKLYTQEEILERMCMALGGRVAESLIFNRITTGAQNDLEKVTKMAYAQVRAFGFSEAVGQVSFADDDSQRGRRPFSDKLAGIIDEEASKIIFECYRRTESILKKNSDKLTLLAEALLKNESLNYDDVSAIIGPPPFGNKNVIEPFQFEGEINSWKEAENN